MKEKGPSQPNPENQQLIAPETMGRYAEILTTLESGTLDDCMQMLNSVDPQTLQSDLRIINNPANVLQLTPEQWEVISLLLTNALINATYVVNITRERLHALQEIERKYLLLSAQNFENIKARFEAAITVFQKANQAYDEYEKAKSEFQKRIVTLQPKFDETFKEVGEIARQPVFGVDQPVNQPPLPKNVQQLFEYITGMLGPPQNIKVRIRNLFAGGARPRTSDLAALRRCQKILRSMNDSFMPARIECENAKIKALEDIQTAEVAILATPDTKYLMANTETLSAKSNLRNEYEWLRTKGLPLLESNRQALSI